jgi:alpha-L-fucosidase
MNAKKQYVSIWFSVIIILFSFSIRISAQISETETDPLVLKNLEEWQDMKFGFMMHWGPYSQWGIVESWSICSEDVPWCRRKMDNYTEYVEAYENLKTTFNPVDFNPEKWARLAKSAGMKYLVFTTKHHDGFCMFDTKLTDYKITDPDCPFHSNPKANIAQELFSAFRAEGFKIGAYFSKPDWHSEDYWWPYFATPDRNVNYDPVKYPERWQRFKNFTYGQIKELMTDYGEVDILWLDGGWVRPKATVNNRSRAWLGPNQYNQDIDMPEIAKMAREKQPGLIFVDRTVTGRYENYRTPEQHVPDEPLDYP